MRRLAIDSLSLDGALDLAGIQQEPIGASATGDALAAVLDLGGIDMGFGF